MSKLFKLLSNSSKIFKYLNVFGYVSDGLSVAIVALESTIAEIYKTNPSFKYVGTLESVLGFIKTAKEAVDTFRAIFGFGVASRPSRKEGVESKEYVEDLNAINGKIQDLLK